MKKAVQKLLLLITTLLIMNSVTAANLVAVNPASCNTLKNTTTPFILVVKKGDNLVESIVKCVNDVNLMSATLSGLGALQQPKLGYFNLDSKQYQYQTFPGVYELTGLTGNIGFADGKRFAHIHVMLGNDQYHLIGGHLKEAKVGATAEITIIPLDAPFSRKFDKNTGLQLITTQQ